ncbi:hypothetical protein HYU23_01930 [Candidatus Woesearchaeota archaeon]|nr:hypothetical protein [Candidatus Woesearchaeota archaeon]
MTGLLDHKRVLNISLEGLAYPLRFLSVPFRAMLGYRLVRIYEDREYEIELVQGLQNGITIRNPRDTLRLFYVPEFLLQDEERARAGDDNLISGNLAAFSSDDKNTFFNQYLRLIDGERKIVTVDIRGEQRLLLEKVFRISVEEKLRRLKEDSNWRKGAIEYSKLLLDVWHEKALNSLSTSREKGPELYDAITGIAEIFRQEMF